MCADIFCIPMQLQYHTKAFSILWFEQPSMKLNIVRRFEIPVLVIEIFNQGIAHMFSVWIKEHACASNQKK